MAARAEERHGTDGRLTEAWPFDREEYHVLARARQSAIEAFLDALSATRPVRTALDVACALGWFTRALHARGLDVMGVDVRAVNVEEARRRHPGLRFAVQDLESPDILAHGPVDFVLCPGVLYHLENPFQAVRHLAALTRVCVYLEGVVINDRRPLAVLCDEGHTESQGKRFVALVPTESCLVKMLYCAGFRHVYRPPLPNDPVFRRSLFHVQQRTALVASYEPLDIPSLTRLTERQFPKPTRERFPLLSRVVGGVRRRLWQA